MKKLLVFLLLLLPVAAFAEEFGTDFIVTEDGLTLSYFVSPRRSLGGDTAELLIQGCCIDGRFEDAYALNLLLAEQGETEAMLRLGNHHLTGMGAAQDDSAAVEWYQRALDGGNIFARYELALASLNGWGTEQNVQAAIDHLTLLAASDEREYVVTRANSALVDIEAWRADPSTGLPEDLSTRPLPYMTDLLADDAMCLGYFWRNGEGGIVDHIEAARWFEKAIELSGNKGVAAGWSHAALAEYYRDGTLGVYDIDKALEHAYTQSDPWSFAGDIYFHGITADDGTIILEPDKEKGIEYYLLGAKKGKPDSLEFVADCYYTGKYLAQDYGKAIELYLDGMQMGSAHCAEVLEGLYAEGKLYSPDMLRSLAWTAGNGRPAPEADEFLLALAQDLIYGKTDADGKVLVEAKQYKYAFQVLRHLGHTSRVNDVFVHNWLGWFYCGNRPEVQAAVYRYAHSHYAQSAQLGNGYAFAQLGILYRDGKYVEANTTTARNCFQQALALGYTQAQVYLDALAE